MASGGRQENNPPEARNAKHAVQINIAEGLELFLKACETREPGEIERASRNLCIVLESSIPECSPTLFEVLRTCLTDVGDLLGAVHRDGAPNVDPGLLVDTPCFRIAEAQVQWLAALVSREGFRLPADQRREMLHILLPPLPALAGLVCRANGSGQAAARLDCVYSWVICTLQNIVRCDAGNPVQDAWASPSRTPSTSADDARTQCTGALRALLRADRPEHAAVALQLMQPLVDLLVRLGVRTMLTHVPTITQALVDEAPSIMSPSADCLAALCCLEQASGQEYVHEKLAGALRTLSYMLGVQMQTLSGGRVAHVKVLPRGPFGNHLIELRAERLREISDLFTSDDDDVDQHDDDVDQQQQHLEGLHDRRRALQAQVQLLDQQIDVVTEYIKDLFHVFVSSADKAAIDDVGSALAATAASISYVHAALAAAADVDDVLELELTIKTLEPNIATLRRFLDSVTGQVKTAYEVGWVRDCPVLEGLQDEANMLRRVAVEATVGLTYSSQYAAWQHAALMLAYVSVLQLADGVEASGSQLGGLLAFFPDIDSILLEAMRLLQRMRGMPGSELHSALITMKQAGGRALAQRLRFGKTPFMQRTSHIFAGRAPGAGVEEDEYGPQQLRAALSRLSEEQQRIQAELGAVIDLCAELGDYAPLFDKLYKAGPACVAACRRLLVGRNHQMTLFMPRGVDNAEAWEGRQSVAGLRATSAAVLSANALGGCDTVMQHACTGIMQPSPNTEQAAKFVVLVEDQIVAPGLNLKQMLADSVVLAPSAKAAFLSFSGSLDKAHTELGRHLAKQWHTLDSLQADGVPMTALETQEHSRIVEKETERLAQLHRDKQWKQVEASQRAAAEAPGSGAVLRLDQLAAAYPGDYLAMIDAAVVLFHAAGAAGDPARFYSL